MSKKGLIGVQMSTIAPAKMPSFTDYSGNHKCEVDRHSGHHKVHHLVGAAHLLVVSRNRLIGVITPRIKSNSQGTC